MYTHITILDMSLSVYLGFCSVGRCRAVSAHHQPGGSGGRGHRARHAKGLLHASAAVLHRVGHRVADGRRTAPPSASCKSHQGVGSYTATCKSHQGAG